MWQWYNNNHLSCCVCVYASDVLFKIGNCEVLGNFSYFDCKTKATYLWVWFDLRIWCLAGATSDCR